MQIFLVRHGESRANVDPTIHEQVADHAIGLSPRGVEQAREAGRAVARLLAEQCPGSERPHVRLWTSPYRRTRETADGIMETSDGWITDRREHVLLCEQQFGLFDGISDEELPLRFPDDYAHYEKNVRFEGKFWARMPLGESRFDVAVRVHQAFGTFHRDRQAKGIEHIVVICHGVTLRAFVMMWCKLTPEWFDSQQNPDNCAIHHISASRYLGCVYPGFPRPASGRTHPAAS